MHSHWVRNCYTDHHHPTNLPQHHVAVVTIHFEVALVVQRACGLAIAFVVLDVVSLCHVQYLDWTIVQG